MFKPKAPLIIWGVLTGDELECYATRKEAREAAALYSEETPATVHKYILEDKDPHELGGLPR